MMIIPAWNTTHKKSESEREKKFFNSDSPISTPIGFIGLKLEFFFSLSLIESFNQNNNNKKLFLLSRQIIKSI